MHFLASLLPTIKAVLPSLAMLAGAALHGYVTKPRHQERAAKADLLSKIANDAAALVYANNPNLPVAQLIRDTVRQISTAAGLPTTDVGAQERAAAAAIAAVRAGDLPRVVKAATTS